MATWTIINNEGGKMLVGKDGMFFEASSTGIADTIHAVQWDGSSGEIEHKDASTGDITHNSEITSFGDYAFAETAWQSAYDAEQEAIALAQAKTDAYNSAYDQAIANGDSEEDAETAGYAASDAVTSL